VLIRMNKIRYDKNKLFLMIRRRSRAEKKFFVRWLIFLFFFVVVFWMGRGGLFFSVRASEGCCYDPSGAQNEICGNYFTAESCATAVGANCQWNPLCEPSSALQELVGLILKFLQWVPFFGALIGGVVLLIAGFMYLTAGDDVKKATQARSAIFYALLGIALSASLYLIVKLIVNIIPGLDQYVQT